MEMSNSGLLAFNKQKFIELIIGTFGIYGTYLGVGLLQQWLIKIPYQNNKTGEKDFFSFYIALMFFPYFITYFIGLAYNKLFIPKNQRVLIPNKNLIFCAFFLLLGGVTFNYAIKWTSYSIVTTVKSCNLLSVIAVGILCSRVTDKKLKLSPNKIVVGIIISIGIVLFKYFDPEVKQKEQKNFQLIGFGALFISVLADGFLPDFQAEIKSKFNPKPTEMMTEISKWGAIISGSYVLFSGEGYQTVIFCLDHKLFWVHFIGLGLLNCLGHFIIYRMIKTFKQHIVPFVITTRKVFTVCLNLVFYNHKTHIGQFIGIILVLGVVIFEFSSELRQSKQKEANQIQKQQQIHQGLEDEGTLDGFPLQTKELMFLPTNKS